MRIQHADGHRRRRIRAEHDPQASVGQFVGDPVARHLHDAEPRDGRARVELDARDGNRRVEPHLGHAPVDGEFERHRLARRARHVVDRAMRGQRGELGRLAVPREIAGARDRHLLELRDPPPDHRRILQVARAQHAIDALAHQIDEAVVLADVQPDPRIAREKIRQRGHDEIARERALQVHAQQPPRRRGAKRALGLLQIGDQPHAAPVVGFAVLREAHDARRPFEQPRAEPRLHALHQVGHGRARNPQIVRGPAEALPLGDPHENLHFLKSVHRVGPRLIVKANGMMISI
ncbi:transcriptional regulator, LysR family domain protein [Burkholderia pseudomallei]|nr:transcriptional regulator, LysR family domain protein [Burkholderia pseudomallei]